MAAPDADAAAARRARTIAERAAQGFGPVCTDEAINDVVAVILGSGLAPVTDRGPSRTRRQTRSRTPAQS